ncbi:MAG: class I SAM-dependent methyltransferase [Terriglobales bacterium]
MPELTPANQKLRAEFNDWAARGKGAAMARHHRAITERAMAGMDIKAGDRVLDLGCGSGWATRLLATRVGPRGLVVGLDISDAMIREAQQHAEAPRNARYLCAPAEQIPWPNDFFTHVLSVENFYYYADQRAVLDELRRVSAPGARLALLMCLYAGSPNAERWISQLPVPVHVRTPKEYEALLADAGWDRARAEVFTPDPADPAPDEHAWACLVTAERGDPRQSTLL